MAIKLFGFTIGKEDEDPVENRSKLQSFATPVSDDGASTVQAGGYFGTYVDLDATSKSEYELITRYREASMYSDASGAIDEILTEAIAAVDDEPIVSINLDSLDIPNDIKDSIVAEFEKVCKLIEFDAKAFDYFRRWYIDGRLYFQKIVDTKNPKRGIVETLTLDPRKIKKIREVKKEKDKDTGIEVIKSVDEYFLYNEKGITYNPGFTTHSANQGIRISTDAITFVPSGIMDMDKNIVLSHLHKAIKPINQLKMMEDALVIYRLARAPERRIFYIDVGNLPKIKAEQYLKDIMARYRNKIVYDSSTGEIRDDRKMMSALEDFWLPRREGGRGTEITTLPGAENLGQIEDINYLQTKLYQSLNVPLSRMQPQTGISFGRATEITRDELKFAKFVGRLRKKFNELFQDLLKTQLILKGVLTDKDWNQIKDDIQYRYAQDQYFDEVKNAENLRNRIDLLNQIQPFVGAYFSQEYVKKNILRMSDKEISDMEAQIDREGPPPQIGIPGMPPGQLPPGQDPGIQQAQQPINNNAQ
jgi:hypothetical protein